MSKMYSWRSKGSDKFWLIFNYSKVVWDINTKFSPVSVLIRFQLFTKFERHSLKNEAAMPLTIKNFSRAWQGHFLSQALQTWQICFFFVDVQMILLSYLDTSDCLEIEKNKKAFLSRYSELFDLSNNSWQPVLCNPQAIQFWYLNLINVHWIDSFARLSL